jgi:hypothetical protein
VLLLDDRPDSMEAERALTSAGHRVHRCRPVGDTSFTCDGIRAQGRCPLDGPIDVALLARHDATSAVPDGTRCALRRGVPLVEHGDDRTDQSPDPLAPMIARHVRPGESVVSGCEAAAEHGKAPLLDAVDERLRPVLDAAHISPDDVRTDLEWRDDAMVVRVEVPGEPDARLEQALAVRVLDAVRGTPRTYGQVNVQVTHRARS